ncbi:MAG TPA: hypothetical protein VNU68_12055 [Verrucomicrobiae bacterium]|nr:hypothetical protein [Verrucomicrobiae bacterium]
MDSDGGPSTPATPVRKLVLLLIVLGLSLSLAAIVTLAPRSRKRPSAEQWPPGVWVAGDSKTHIHANLTKLRTENFPALAQMHALFTVCFDGEGGNDEKLMALSQLRFTNLACVVFTDCPLVTDTGVEYLSQISSATNLALRGMSVSDAACELLASRIQLCEVNMPRCTNVTVKGLLKMAQSESIASLGFSLGKMTQDDLIQLITNAGPRLGRMDIDMDNAVHERLDFPAILRVAEARKIRLFGVRRGYLTPFGE